MNNIEKYIDALFDDSKRQLEGAKIEAANEDDREIRVLKAEIDAYVSSFDAVRTSYISDLERLREVYRPVFKTILSLIKNKRQELKALEEIDE